MKPLHTLLALAVSGLLLTACDKKAETSAELKTETKTEAAAPTDVAPAPTTSETTSSPAALSPYMDFQVTANRAGIMAIMQQNHPNLTEVQKTCLTSTDGNANYVSILEPHFKSILTDDEIKQADEFLVTSAGEKFKAMMYNAIGVPNTPAFVEPVGKEKEELMAAMLMPFVVKVKTNTDNMSEEEALAFIGQIVDKEKVRCNIS